MMLKAAHLGDGLHGSAFGRLSRSWCRTTYLQGQMGAPAVMIRGEITPLWGEPIMHMQHVDRLPSQLSEARLHRLADRASYIVHLLRCQPPLVWLKKSAVLRRVAIIVAQQPTQPLSTPHLIAVAPHAGLGCDKLIGETLMIPFMMIMGDVLLNGIRP
jgi:hypothetical protein